MAQLITDLDLHQAKPRIKVVFFDIDGTLLDPAGRYSARLREELARIRRLGVRTAIASGRPHFAARFLMEELELWAPGLFCSGALIFDPAAGRSLQLAALPRDASRVLLTRLRQLKIYYEVYGAQDFYVETDFAPEISELHAHHLRQPPVAGALDAVIDGQPLLKWVLATPLTERGQLQMLEREFPDLTFSYAAFPACPDWQFVNVIDRLACKRQAFAWLLDHYQVAAEEVASFGDSHSDEVFLQLAGTGVAMGNASDEVKAVAKYVTKTSAEDGVAFALSKLI